MKNHAGLQKITGKIGKNHAKTAGFDMGHLTFFASFMCFLCGNHEKSWGIMQKCAVSTMGHLAFSDGFYWDFDVSL